MATGITKFDFGSLSIRSLTIEGVPWFVATDVCRALGYSNAFHPMRMLASEDKGIHVLETPGGRQGTTIVTEPGLYKLIQNSRKPGAKAFDRWVRHEVLPSIRKTGSYSIKGPVPNTSQVVAVRSPALPAAPSPISEALRMIEARTSAILAELVRLRNPVAGRKKGPSGCCACPSQSASSQDARGSQRKLRVPLGDCLASLAGAQGGAPFRKHIYSFPGDLHQEYARPHLGLHLHKLTGISKTTNNNRRPPAPLDGPTFEHMSEMNLLPNFL